MLFIKDMSYKRLLNLQNLTSSLFLFGPRMVGKTQLMSSLNYTRFIDLLDIEQYLALLNNPVSFLNEIKALPKESLIIIDEIQKIPQLLDSVQIGIDKYSHRFILSGSSARKLKRNRANLLGGRALDFRLHPLTTEEIGEDFDISQALQFGTLPKISTLTQHNLAQHNLAQHNQQITEAQKTANLNEARLILKAYNTIYLREEIQAEAITRNIMAFQRFLLVAADSDTKMIEYANIAETSNVPDSTVKEYFSILEDTLIAKFLWPWDHSERKKARPKLYFFDCGVVRALTNRLYDPPTNLELGSLFESWFVNEILRLKDYYNIQDDISFWREDSAEVDLLIHRGDKFKLAIEIKTSQVNDADIKSLHRFKMKNPKIPCFVASLKLQHKQILPSGIEVLPWKEALVLFKEKIINANR